MNPSEMGQVFSFLLTYREAMSDPNPMRNRREGEAEVVKILSNAYSINDLDDFEQFIEVQGFALKIYDGTDFGLAPKGLIPRYYFLIRNDSEMNPYLDRRWIVDQVARAQGESRDESAAWAIQMWLHLQSFFYTHINRLVTEVSRFGEALVSVKTLTDALHDTIEKLRSEGRPDGDKGTVWDLLTKANKQKIELRVKKFLRALKEAGQIVEAGDNGEYKQSMLAAVEMSIILERGLKYLVPQKQNAGPQEVINMLTGNITEEA